MLVSKRIKKAAQWMRGFQELIGNYQSACQCKFLSITQAAIWTRELTPSLRRMRVI
jgi:hypothetical protein